MKKKDISHVPRKFSVTIGLLITVVFISYSSLITSPQNFIFGEFVQFWAYGNEVVKKNFLEFGQLGLWDTYNSLGYPLMAGLSSPFYPFTLLFYYPFPNPLLGINLSALFHLILAAFSFYYLSRILMANHWASVIGSCFYLLNTYVVTSITKGFFGDIYNLVWMPLTIAFLWQALFRRKLYYAPLAGVAFSMNIISMSVYPIYFLTFILLLIFIFFLLYNIKKIKAVFLYGILCGILLLITALGLSAIKLFPVLELKNLSTRDTISLYTENTKSTWTVASPQNIYNFIFPISLESKLSILKIVNIIFLFFVFTSFLIRKKEILFFGILGFIAMWAAFAFNAFVDIFKFLYLVVPGLNTLQIVTRFFIVSHLALAILATFGIHYMIEKVYAKRNTLIRKNIYLSLFFFALVILLVLNTKLQLFNFIRQEAIISVSSHSYSNNALDKLTQLVRTKSLPIHTFSIYTPPGKYLDSFPALQKNIRLVNQSNGAFTTTYQYLLFNNNDRDSENTRKKYKLLGLMNTKYVIAEKQYDDYPNDYIKLAYNISNGINYIHPITKKDEANIYELTSFTPFIHKTQKGILLIGDNSLRDFNSFDARILYLNKNFDQNRFSILTTSRTVDTFSLDELAQFDGIIIPRHIKINNNLATYTKSGGKILTLQFRENRYTNLQDRSLSIQTNQPARWIDRDDEKRFTDFLTSLSENQKEKLNSEITLVHITPEDLRFKINTVDSLTYVTLADSYYPGWHLYIDGTEQNLYMANSLIKGFIIKGAGNHEVHLIFKPISFYMGAFLSFITLIALLIYYFTLIVKYGKKNNYFLVKF